MPALIIGAEEQQTIRELRAFAAANVFDTPAMIQAAQNEDAYRDMMRLLSLELPIGFHVTYCHERQPVGVVKHISVSVARPNKLPSPEAVEMILEAFGMTPIKTSLRVWKEVVTPAITAINLLQPISLTG